MKKVFKVVYIVWEDACSIEDWTPLEEARKYETTRCVTVGHLILKDKDKIIIALNIHPNGPEVKVSDCMIIPTKNIKQFRFIG